MIPVNTPTIGEAEKKYVMECLNTGWISSEGPMVAEFEKSVAKQTQRVHGVAVCNATAALDIAVRALHIGQGDEVILGTFTIFSCASAIVNAGAVPVFVDQDRETWNLDVTQIENAITPRTKAIMAVHIYGLPADMDPILALAKKHNLFVIEDAAQLQGHDYKGRPCGSMGDISVISFYPNKQITTGEGGIILANDQKLADRSRYLRNLCFEPARRFVHQEIGWNYRMTSLQAALGLGQMERLEENVRKRRNMGLRYRELLDGIEEIELSKDRTPYGENLYWVFGLILNEKTHLTPEEVCKKLLDKGIGTRPFFWCLHEQPVFMRAAWYKKQNLPVGERMARRGFYLPSSLSLSDDDAMTVVKALKEVLL